MNTHATARSRMPTRRPCETVTVHDSRGLPFDISIGRYPVSGEIGEVFVTGRGKTGTLLDGLLFDLGVAVSLALQSGARASDLAASCARNEDGSPASVMGAALDMIARDRR